MRTSDITPKDLAAYNQKMRKAVAQYVTGDPLQKFISDAKRQLQEKQERVTALREMLAAMDAAKFVSSGNIAFDCNFKRNQFVHGTSHTSEDGYRSLLAQDIEELGQLKNALEIMEAISNKSEIRA